MATLSIQTGTTAGISAIGETIQLDFSNDVPAGSSIVAYAVGLAGFLFNYETNSDYWAENMGMLAVRLVPNLVGNQITVTASAIMTDYDGDAGRSTAAGGSDPACNVQFTVMALIDSAFEPYSVLGNIYGLANSQNTPPVNVNDNRFNAAFLAGFNLTASSPGSLDSVNVAVSSSVSSSELTASSAVSAGSINTDGSVDVMFFSPEASITNFQGVLLDLVFSPLTGQNESGMSASFNTNFTIPSGYTSIKEFGLVQQSVSIQYSGTEEFQVVEAYFSNLSVSGSTLTGEYTLNIYNPDFGSRTYISGSSTANIYAFAIFE